MRKQELVHLHALGVAARREVGERRDATSSAFDAYDDLDVDPSSIHRRKDAHRRAIRTLFAGVAATCPEDPSPDLAVSGEADD